jgi:hypothetical protein
LSGRGYYAFFGGDAARELVGIDAFLIRRRHDQQMNSARGKRIAESQNSGNRIVRCRFNTAVAGEHVIETRPVEEPAVASKERFISAVAKPSELRELKPRPERAGHDTGVF